MLIDELLSNPILQLSGMLSEDLRGRLSKATKFVLAKDFAIAADEFSSAADNSSAVDNLNRVLPLARLPYPECWLEVAQQDRHCFMHGQPLQAGDGPIKRVGFLLTQTDASGGFSAQMFWSFVDGHSFLGHQLPPCRVNLMALIDPHAADCVHATGLAEITRHIGNAEDWIGEPGFIIATLALLQSRNAAETELVEPRSNQRRRLLRQTPLYSYHLVGIPQRYRIRQGISADEPMQLRAHFVRGHFKVRRTGIFFWSSYQRGNPALGFVHKDYMLSHPRTLQ
jgi:hypothetical protein